MLHNHTNKLQGKKFINSNIWYLKKILKSINNINWVTVLLTK